MATASEIRKWAVGEDRSRDKGTTTTDGVLLFRLPEQPASVSGKAYLRCAAEQRVIVDTEIAAQLAELNATLREWIALIRPRVPAPKNREQ